MPTKTAITFHTAKTDWLEVFSQQGTDVFVHVPYGTRVTVRALPTVSDAMSPVPAAPARKVPTTRPGTMSDKLAGLIRQGLSDAAIIKSLKLTGSQTTYPAWMRAKMRRTGMPMGKGS